MQVRNDKNRMEKTPEVGDVLFIGANKYTIYEITNASFKVESNDERIAAGYKRKDFINKNRFFKTRFFDKQKQYWQTLQVSRVPNFDYM